MPEDINIAAAKENRQAAINYERDMEFLNFSECFYKSRECLRKFFTRSLFAPGKIQQIGAGVMMKEGAGHNAIRRLILCVSLTFSALIWGHGERPGRTLCSAIIIFLSCTLFYMYGNLIKDAVIFRPNFLQALYFSVITFTTVGYGDITPVGLSRFVAMLEVLSSIFIVPIFVVGLSRRYLRT